jgi:hypothetical protein
MTTTSTMTTTPRRRPRRRPLRIRHSGIPSSCATFGFHTPDSLGSFQPIVARLSTTGNLPAPSRPRHRPNRKPVTCA